MKNEKKDKQFGTLIFELKNNAFKNFTVPTFVIIIGSVLLIIGNRWEEPIIWFVIGTILLLSGLYMLGNFLFDRLKIYEQGLVQSSILSANKIRIPYRTINKIEIETKKFKTQYKNKQVSWYQLIDHKGNIIYAIKTNEYQDLEKAIKTIEKYKKKS